MNFIGVDLHKKIITVCVMNEKLVVVGRKTLYASQPDEIVGFVTGCTTNSSAERSEMGPIDRSRRRRGCAGSP